MFINVFFVLLLRSNGISTAKSYNTVIGSGRSTISVL